MMKHCRFTAREAIGWMRVCRPGSVIGPQQQFLEQIQTRMWTDGDSMRRVRELPLAAEGSRLAAAQAAAAAAARANASQQQYQQQQQTVWSATGLAVPPHHRGSAGGMTHVSGGGSDAVDASGSIRSSNNSSNNNISNGRSGQGATNRSVRPQSAPATLAT